MNVLLNLIEVDRNIDELKRYFLEGSFVCKEVVICCVEFLKFFFNIDEIKEI